MMDIRKDTPKDADSKRQDKYKAILSQLSRDTQAYAVLNHLLTCGSITTFEAFSSYGITRLSARISDLKDIGCDIDCEIVWNKKTHYGIYRLEY